ncbi:MBL fold metallo-hydrolase [Thomasclavelia sp.]|uniref:MBL fold metallo-hydrolase n=1 Tax=Thomasclavelia sp. TaxID=3025757 RepID=UPI0025CB9737|nr:MBL fold metallo-hydrolase [Thomasclavelia sp.]
MEIKELYPDFYVFDDGRVREFLIKGNDEALLIDTGFVDNDIVSKIKEITDLPVKVVLTHGDLDHSGGLKDFDQCYLHQNDMALIDKDIKMKPLFAGDLIKVGKYCFEVIEIPGHTYGSIALLDRKKKLLLPGDSVQKGPIYMFGKHRNLTLYLESLKKLLLDIDDIETIIPSHHEYPLSNKYLKYCLEDGRKLSNNLLSGEKHDQLPCYTYFGDHVSFYY